MHRVLATLVAAALLIGCSDPKAEQRAAYLASGEAHAAADADYNQPYAMAASKAAIKAADAVGTDEFYPAVREADAAAENAWEKGQENAKGPQEHAKEIRAVLLGYRPTLDSDRAAKIEALMITQLEASLKLCEAVERAQASGDGARFALARAAALEASRKAWEAAERAKASHD